MTTHGFREDFKEEEQEKEKEEKVKEKEKEDEDFSDQEIKEKEREKEKEKVILLKMKVIGFKMNGKDMKMKIGINKMNMDASKSEVVGMWLQVSASETPGWRRNLLKGVWNSHVSSKTKTCNSLPRSGWTCCRIQMTKSWGVSRAGALDRTVAMVLNLWSSSFFVCALPSCTAPPPFQNENDGLTMQQRSWTTGSWTL